MVVQHVAECRVFMGSNAPAQDVFGVFHCCRIAHVVLDKIHYLHLFEVGSSACALRRSQ